MNELPRAQLSSPPSPPAEVSPSPAAKVSPFSSPIKPSPISSPAAKTSPSPASEVRQEDETRGYLIWFQQLCLIVLSEEERALYINEYMNVVCGRIVSKINTLTDSVSKLSVPEYFGENDPDYGRDEQAYHIMLVYRNGQGFVRFIIQFEFQQNGGDDV